MTATSFVLCAVIASRSTGHVGDSTTLAEMTVLEGRRGVLQGVSVGVAAAVSHRRRTGSAHGIRYADRLCTVASCAVHGAASVQPGVGVAVTELDELLGSRELEAAEG
jgi:hypothetical protein